MLSIGKENNSLGQTVKAFTLAGGGIVLLVAGIGTITGLFSVTLPPVLWVGIGVALLGMGGYEILTASRAE